MPPVDLLVHGSMVRQNTRRAREPLHDMMIVFVLIQAAPVYLQINDNQ
jgi:hypothetical protein